MGITRGGFGGLVIHAGQVRSTGEMAGRDVLVIGPGNSDINATVSLPHPCIAPIVFVFGAPNVGWFAATGG